MIALGVCCVAVALSAQSVAAEPVRLDGGASASGTTTIIVLSGTDAASRTSILVDEATGELVVREETEVSSPGDPCTPAAGTPTTEFRCPPGTVGAIVGNLGPGADRLVAAPDVRALIGARIGGAERPLRGGPGGDLIAGGAGGDSLIGSGGRDRLLGRGGTDLLNGAAAADRLLGGRAGDVLLGANGPDRLDGGAGRDLCNGGTGRDSGRRCFATRNLP